MYPNLTRLVYLCKGNVKTGSHTGRIAGEHHVRGQGDVLTSLEKPKIASKAPDARRKAWGGSSYTALRRNQPR